MNHLIPAGAVPLAEAELDTVIGGGVWRLLAGAAAFGYTAGRWVACAVQCIVFE